MRLDRVWAGGRFHTKYNANVFALCNQRSRRPNYHGYCFAAIHYFFTFCNPIAFIF